MVAPYICDPLIVLDPSRKSQWCQVQGVAAWQLRALVKDVLPTWSNERIDWLLNGGSKQKQASGKGRTDIAPNNPRQLVDYKQVFAHLFEDEGGDDGELGEEEVMTWEHWRKIWSEDHEQYYFSNTRTRARSWEPPENSPWNNVKEEIGVGVPMKAAGVGKHSEDKQLAEEAVSLPPWWGEMVHKIESKTKNVRTLFRNFDEDKSGTLSMGEFRRGLQHIGVVLDDERFEELRGIVDEDGSGEVDYQEFALKLARSDDAQSAGVFGSHQGQQWGTGAHSSKSKGAQSSAPWATAAIQQVPTWLRELKEKLDSRSRNVRVLFRSFDEDKSGSVDVGEFRKALWQLGFSLSDKQFTHLVKLVDSDDTGEISYTNFAQARPAQTLSRPCSVRRALLTPQVNPRSFYRCGKSSSEQLVSHWQGERGPETRP